MNERIKQLRSYLGLTQQEFADRIGIKRNSIANYEIGRNEPIDAVVSLICREFHASERWLRTGEGEMFEALDADQSIADFAAEVLADRPESFRKRLVSVLSSLDERDWAALGKIADALINKKTDP